MAERVEIVLVGWRRGEGEYEAAIAYQRTVQPSRPAANHERPLGGAPTRHIPPGQPSAAGHRS